MATAFGIIGRGWSFPPTFKKSLRTVEMLTDAADINSSLEILLSTLVGERVMQPRYGCDLSPFIFESVSTTLKTFMAEKIKTALLYFEPRILVNQVKVEDHHIYEGYLSIHIDYQIRTTNSRYNYVYDYYVKEGTEIGNK